MLSVQYIAGFFDADGCVCRCLRPDGKYRWEANIVQTTKNDKNVLTQIHKQYGGSLCVVKHKPPKTDTRRWKVEGVDAAIFLSDIYTHIHVKKEKAAQALEFFASIKKIVRVLDRLREPRWLYANPEVCRHIGKKRVDRGMTFCVECGVEVL